MKLISFENVFQLFEWYGYLFGEEPELSKKKKSIFCFAFAIVFILTILR